MEQPPMAETKRADSMAKPQKKSAKSPKRGILRMSGQFCKSLFKVDSASGRKEDPNSTHGNGHESDGDSIIDDCDEEAIVFAPILEIVDHNGYEPLSASSTGAEVKTTKFSIKSIPLMLRGAGRPRVAKKLVAEAEREHNVEVSTCDNRDLGCSVIGHNGTESTTSPSGDASNRSSSMMSKLFGGDSKKRQSTCNSKEESRSVFYIDVVNSQLAAPAAVEPIVPS